MLIEKEQLKGKNIRKLNRSSDLKKYKEYLLWRKDHKAQAEIVSFIFSKSTDKISIIGKRLICEGIKGKDRDSIRRRLNDMDKGVLDYDKLEDGYKLKSRIHSFEQQRVETKTLSS